MILKIVLGIVGAVVAVFFILFILLIMLGNALADYDIDENGELQKVEDDE